MFKVVSTLNIQTLRRHYFTDLAQLTSHSPPSPPSSPPRSAGVQPTDGALLGLQPPPTAAARAERTPRDAYGAPVPARAVGMAVSHPQSPLSPSDAWRPRKPANAPSQDTAYSGPGTPQFLGPEGSDRRTTPRGTRKCPVARLTGGFLATYQPFPAVAAFVVAAFRRVPPPI
jgi:hypothetical protein